MASHTTLKVRDLRALARLHREGAQGTDTELLDLASHRPDDLAKVLGVSHEWVVDALKSDDPVERLVHAIEVAPKRARTSQKNKARARAEHLAVELAHSARWDGRRLRLDPSALTSLTRTPGYRWLGLPVGDEQVHLFDRTRLGAILRECQKTRIDVLWVDAEELRIEYGTHLGEGAFRLRPLIGPVRPEEVLVAPLPGRPEQGIHQELEVPPSPEQPRPPETRPVLARVLRALSGALGP